jgi:hypothetical protein
MKFIVILAVLISPIFANGSEVQERAKKKAQKYMVGAFTSGEIKGALKKSNTGPSRSSKDTPADIATKDKEWRAWKKGASMPAFVKTITSSSCTQVLEGFNSRYRFATEAFVTNNRGETICAAPATSDYDQGDEAKWFNVFVQNENPHISAPEKDESSGQFQMQVSYPIEDGGKKVGVITIGIKTK